MLVGLLLVSAASLWGIDALHQDYGVALQGYQRLRQAYVAGTHLSTAQVLLQWPHPRSLMTARAEVRAAVTDFAALSDPSPGWNAAAAGEVRVALQSIADRLERIESANESPTVDAFQAERDAIFVQLGRISRLSSGIRRAIENAQAAADSKRRTTFAIVGALCGIVVCSAVVLGVLHYRGVMVPIRRLTAGVRRLTTGQFKDRIDARGKDEWASLARDFNHMAGELDGFYHQLEQKVADKSRELIRSERLASVGYLAAGVAHEINNPLGIISGYAEFAIGELRKRVESAPATPPLDEAIKSLQIICDEAFRCKAITQKLLSLARGGGGVGGGVEVREVVSLLDLASEVASIIGGLKEHRDKRLIVQSETGEESQTKPPVVNAVEHEMKQVLLNLTINALEAVPPGGEVRVEVRRQDGWVELAVVDNGRGMSADTLVRVFEPFFTEKRDVVEEGVRGTGLGLSITHAIIQSHGGTLSASSEGPGRGSRFTVRLPVALGARVKVIGEIA